MGRLYQLAKEGLAGIDKFGCKAMEFTPEEMKLMETGRQRYELHGLKRRMTPTETEIFFSAFCSGVVIGGEMLR